MLGDRRYSIILVIALLVAGGATIGVYRVITDMRASSRVVTQPVVIAAEDIPEGAALTPSKLSITQLPAAAVPTGAFTTTDSVLARVARVPIFKGEAIVPGRLAPEGTTAGIEVKIAPGKRAMAVRIDDVAGISGLIQPNSRVDVLVTIADQTNSGRISKVFMENMRVLSVGTNVQRGADGTPINAATATLEVEPEEAERLALAAREGSIQLVLRGYGDPDSIRTSGARPTDVLAQLRDTTATRTSVPVRQTTPRPRTSPPPRPATTTPTAPATVVIPPNADSVTVKIYRGDKLSQQKFDTAKARRDTIKPPSN
jgi:pilus assembly protein CpaB